jgi:hypothetical protein
MDPNLLAGYISLLSRESSLEDEIDRTSLNFLEYFAWKKYVSSYQICVDIRHTPLKMAYKNVNKRVNGLVYLGLLEQVNIDNENKHDANYYRLSEYGIYHLFLKRPNSVLINQSDLWTSNELSSNASVFFNNYINCKLFEIFLYPYFNKSTLFVIKDRFLWDLYPYLSSCCQKIERYLKHIKMREISQIDVSLREVHFSWDRVPGKDNKLLLSQLAQLFKIEDLESNGRIKKDTVDGDFPTITVDTNSAPIIIKLDKKINEVRVMYSRNGNFQEYTYSVHLIGDEMVVSNKIPQENYLNPIVDEAEKQMQQLIYKFVSELASSPRNSETSYYYDVLSRDKKFMKVVKEIYEKQHRSFESGYELLRKRSDEDSCGRPT